MPAAVHTATLGALTLKQIESSSFAWNGTPVELNASGAVDVSEYLGGPGEYRIGFESTDLASIAAVASFASSGLSVSAGTITIPYQVRAHLGTFAGAGGHVAFSATNGLIWPDTFSLPAGGNASCSLTCMPFAPDGVTDPVTINDAASISAETPTAMYTLGPVAINGIALSQLVGVTITTGIEVLPLAYEGNYPVQLFIVRRRPVLEVQHYNLSESEPSWLAGSSATVYARKRSQSGFVADATAEHVLFTLGAGLIAPVQSITGAGVGGNSTRTVRYWAETLTVTGSSAIA